MNETETCSDPARPRISPPDASQFSACIVYLACGLIVVSKLVVNFPFCFEPYDLRLTPLKKCLLT